MAGIKRSAQDEFDISAGNGVFLAYFNAPWCRPCLVQDPIVDGIEKMYRRRVHCAKIDIDKNREIALNLAILSIPTIILFKDGREMRRFVGVQTTDTLSRTLSGILDDLAGALNDLS